MNRRRIVAVLLAAAALLTACNSSNKSDQAVSQSPGNDAASTTKPAGSPKATIAMITHGDGGSFWSVTKKGAEQAANEMGITLNYSESNNDPQKQAQLIEAAVAQNPDGIAVSAPNPSAIKDALKKATDKKIPVITLNSGADVFEDLGAVTHVGQTEQVAGQGAGEKLKATGATKLLCVIHEQSNVGLQQRCDGTRSTFGGVEDFQVTGTKDAAKTLSEIQAKLTTDNTIDAVLTLNPDIATAARDAVKASSSKAKVATFDLSTDVISAIKDGSIQFAVDQQQFLQGYLPVVFLYLNKANANTIGGGLPVLTGPGFVTKDNADTVAKLASAGTR